MQVRLFTLAVVIATILSSLEAHAQMVHRQPTKRIDVSDLSQIKQVMNKLHESNHNFKDATEVPTLRGINRIFYEIVGVDSQAVVLELKQLNIPLISTRTQSPDYLPGDALLTVVASPLDAQIAEVELELKQACHVDRIASRSFALVTYSDREHVPAETKAQVADTLTKQLVIDWFKANSVR